LSPKFGDHLPRFSVIADKPWEHRAEVPPEDLLGRGAVTTVIL
jgi:hypothetical protein